MNYHPYNTASQYTTKLNEVMELDGNWEVGLLEASFPSKADNVLPDECFFTVQIIVAMHLAQRRTFRLPQNPPLYTTFRSVQRKTRFAMKITSSLVKKVSFSEDLTCLLGFQPHKDYTGRPKNMAELPVNLTGSQNLLYVYCDVLEQVLVGDTKAPLLRITNKSSTETTSHAEHVTFNPIQYVPLQNKCFDSVTVYMMNDAGMPMPFLAGKSLVVLEFRGSAHPYLLL